MHRERVAQDVRSLEARAGRTNGRFWLYFAFDLETGYLAIETSWLPDSLEVKSALVPLGFERREDGAYRVIVKHVAMELAVIRLATKALGVLLKEGYL